MLEPDRTEVLLQRRAILLRELAATEEELAEQGPGRGVDPLARVRGTYTLSRGGFVDRVASFRGELGAARFADLCELVCDVEQYVSTAERLSFLQRQGRTVDPSAP
jgi:hypothetical protein